ncbi:hypothetical protein IWX90DRAFT_99514 [Phyllosticta citrichinensis]|uniref:Uncharacterized protein n=1 Tax=Phyllosticta citrichinensis TaxID=1130410 RepID=A0ABR1Y1N5_9PEZI
MTTFTHPSIHTPNGRDAQISWLPGRLAERKQGRKRGTRKAIKRGKKVMNQQEEKAERQKMKRASQRTTRNNAGKKGVGINNRLGKKAQTRTHARTTPSDPIRIHPDACMHESRTHEAEKEAVAAAAKGVVHQSQRVRRSCFEKKKEVGAETQDARRGPRGKEAVNYFWQGKARGTQRQPPPDDEGRKDELSRVEEGGRGRGKG